MTTCKPNIRNVGVFAHVDAGKTTVCEQMLFQSGAIRFAGSVDNGNCSTDPLDIERARGISVRLAEASFVFDDVRINLIDTPGHVDFSSEVEQSLGALDCALLVISAVQRVQAHTETIWKALLSRNLPTIIFINKIDRIGANIPRCLDEIRKEMTRDLIAMQDVVDPELQSARPGHTWSKEDYETENQSELIKSIIEQIAEKDDDLLRSYLDGESIQFDHLDRALADKTKTCEIYPVYLGQAKTGAGIKQLLYAIKDLLPGPKGNDDNPVSGVVYKMDFDKALGKTASVRLFDGVINNRDIVLNATLGRQQKVTQIKQVSVNQYHDISTVHSGETAVLCGLSDARVGDILGEGETTPKKVKLGSPLLRVKVAPKKMEQINSLAQSLYQLNDEDPSLDVMWIRDQNELSLNINGPIQTEVLEFVLSSRFGIESSFGTPTIIYKETPDIAGFASERYWMPKPCWAIVKFKIEPGQRGSGVVYESKVATDAVAPKYQNEIERNLKNALKQGIKGWEVTDLKITFVEGEDHSVHSRPGDFIVATSIALMKGLKEIGTTLLEPILNFKITAPESALGTITGDLTKMRAIFDSPSFQHETFVMVGKVPAATSLDYPIRLASSTGGKGKLVTSFKGYEKCDLFLGETTPFRGVNPLDREKFILHARKAF